MSFAKFENEWRATIIEDRNGNLINVSYNWQGDINSITETLGRVINFNYDVNANLSTITQSWLVNGVTKTHTWASFGWGAVTMQPNFGLEVVGTHNNESIPVLTSIGFGDDTYDRFSYNGAGQITRISHFAPDSNPASD